MVLEIVFILEIVLEKPYADKWKSLELLYTSINIYNHLIFQEEHMHLFKKNKLVGEMRRNNFLKTLSQTHIHKTFVLGNRQLSNNP